RSCGRLRSSAAARRRRGSPTARWRSPSWRRTTGPRPPPVGRAVAEPAGAQDPLSTLREHVRFAQQAAERLAQAAGRPAAAGEQAPAADEPGHDPGGGPDPPPPGRDQTPPSGWASDPDRQTAAELRALVELVESL